jgi:8-oxo-dGTP pyrophosphatase MutT (NUDIX family)
MRNHWGLFGGLVEKNENPAQALARELAEELLFRPRRAPEWFTEVSVNLDFVPDGVHRKIFYAAPIVVEDLDTMRLGEGQAMRLFAAEEILSRSDAIPWDVFGLMLFARRQAIRASIKRRQY